MFRGSNETEAMHTMQCCVPACESNSRDTSVTFYSFPKKRRFRDEWIKALEERNIYSDVLGFNGPEILSRIFMCNRHFTSTDFECFGAVENRRRSNDLDKLNQDVRSLLKDEAVPSVFEMNAVKGKCEENINPTPDVVKANVASPSKASNRLSLKSDNREVPISKVALSMRAAVSLKMNLNTPEKSNLPPSPAQSGTSDIKKSKKGKKTVVKMSFPARSKVSQVKVKNNTRPQSSPQATRIRVAKVQTVQELQPSQCPSPSKNKSTKEVKILSKQCPKKAFSPKSVKQVLALPNSAPANLSCDRNQSRPLQKKAKRVSTKIAKPRSIQLEKTIAGNKKSPPFAIRVRKSTGRLNLKKSLSQTFTDAKAVNVEPTSPRTGTRSLYVSEDSERKQAGIVQSMFSDAITKVFLDTPKAEGKSIIASALKSRLQNGVENQCEYDPDAEMVIDEDACQSSSAKIGRIDVNEEYGTPLLNGFDEFDMDGHEVIEDDIPNETACELLDPHDVCDYASDTSENADEAYYALIPKIEVNEEVYIENNCSEVLMNGSVIEAGVQIGLELSEIGGK